MLFVDFIEGIEFAKKLTTYSEPYKSGAGFGFSCGLQEGYNQFSNPPANPSVRSKEDEKLNILISAGRGVLFSLSERKIIFEAMDVYKSSKPDAVEVLEWIIENGWQVHPNDPECWGKLQFKNGNEVEHKVSSSELYQLSKAQPDEQIERHLQRIKQIQASLAANDKKDK